MAVTEISSDSDLEGIINPHAKKRLTPTGWANWNTWHQKAWEEIKAHLKNLPDTVEEADLSDPTEFKPAAIHFVAFLAYQHGGNWEMARHHKAEYARQMNQINWTPAGSSEADGQTWGAAIEMERG